MIQEQQINPNDLSIEQLTLVVTQISTQIAQSELVKQKNLQALEELLAVIEQKKSFQAQQVDIKLPKLKPLSLPSKQ